EKPRFWKKKWKKQGYFVPPREVLGRLGTKGRKKRPPACEEAIRKAGQAFFLCGCGIPCYNGLNQ
ncbi:hypothetical protein LI177_14475, partial [bacterium 210820-DFI.6.37]|nr:hypothetical protein [bacterium 210820-DFI.6.37]